MCMWGVEVGLLQVVPSFASWFVIFLYYYVVYSAGFMVIRLSRPSARASPPASRKVFRNSVTKSAQLSLVMSGTSSYHFNTSPFNNPWKICLLASRSSSLVVVINLNS